ncbi:universal stress protein [Halosegnis marinus]|uniref:Universal stress protein n=1 Tax=Halosegnis marinus TaxID=3034023 RepID=A0ABD5ZNK1_9EURY|nr:universal stress protein [Halosegnis sp. DT85]
MFDTVVIATDGSESGRRAVEAALDLAATFGAAVHALYVVDESRVDALPEDVHEEVHAALESQAAESLAAVRGASDREVTVAVREGRPATEITAYAREVEADVVATGTRGRDGEHSFLLGSVAEAVVRTCPVPVLTVRQLEAGVEG